MKRQLTLTLCSMLLAAVMIQPAYALYDPNQTYTPQPGEMHIMQAPAQPASGQQQLAYQLVVNGVKLGDQAKVINLQLDEKQLMLPLRPVAEQLGYTVTWNQANQQILLAKAEQQAVLTLGKSAYSLNHQQTSLTTALKQQNGVTYVPLSFLHDGLQADAQITGKSTITITTKQK